MASDQRDHQSPRFIAVNKQNAPRLGAPHASSATRESPATPRLAANMTTSAGKPVHRPRLANMSSASGKVVSSRDTTASPTTAISPNVTPRSPRRQRAGSGRSTPLGAIEATPRTPQPLPTGHNSTVYAESVPFFRAGHVSRPRSYVERRPSTSSAASINPFVSSRNLQSPTSPVTQHQKRQLAETSSFFYADQAQNEPPIANIHKETSQFFHVDGRDETSEDNTRSPYSRALPSLADKERGSMSERTASTPVSPQSEIISHPFPLSFHANSPTFFRTPSPPKESFHLSYRKGASQIIRPKLSASLSQNSVSENQSSTTLEHQVTTFSNDIDLDSPLSRKGSPSSPKDEARPQPRQHSSATDPLLTSSSRRSSMVSPLVPPDSRCTTDPGINVAVALGLDSSSASSCRPVSTPGGDSTAQLIKDLAANARRERKLLDLEISNTSLLAINRSLEREVRKQKIDLRRFRRISRVTSRNSWLSEADSNDPGALNSATDGLGRALPDLIEQDDEDSEDISDLDSADEENMSPTALAENDAKHHERDARRLRLDLAKHKELLIDSQKMNQSLKRCLGWTEQLIKDGNKALQYQVDTSSLKLGGKVLSPEELDAAKDQYFSPHADEDSASLDDEWRLSGQHGYHAGSDATDKDSGVDLEFGQRFHDSGKQLRSSIARGDDEHRII